MNFGNKISTLRKQHGMTQAELGEQLNVTYQAVSKWECDESKPDFTMMSRIAKLFGVSLSYFEENEEADLSAQNTEPNKATERAEKQIESAFVGVCTECGRSVYEEDAETDINGKLICKSCAEKRRCQIAEKQKATEADHIKYANQLVTTRNRGFIVGSLACAAMLVLFIVLIITKPDKATMAILGTILTILTFFTVTQLFWDGAVATVAFTGGKIIGTPGIIFSLDLDGFIFLIAVKILFAILKFIIFIITFLFFVLIAAIISPFTFGPCLHRVNNEIRDRRSGKIVCPSRPIGNQHTGSSDRQ